MKMGKKDLADGALALTCRVWRSCPREALQDFKPSFDTFCDETQRVFSAEGAQSHTFLRA